MQKNKIKTTDYFKFNNIKNFVQGNWNKLKQDSYFLKLDVHIQEQAIYRASLCRDCFNSTSCLVCGCAVPQLFYAPNKEDANDKWGKMLSETEWEEFKKSNNIDVKAIEDSLNLITKKEEEKDETKG